MNTMDDDLKNNPCQINWWPTNLHASLVDSAQRAPFLPLYGAENSIGALYKCLRRGVPSLDVPPWFSLSRESNP